MRYEEWRPLWWKYVTASMSQPLCLVLLCIHSWSLNFWVVVFFLFSLNIFNWYKIFACCNRIVPASRFWVMCSTYSLLCRVSVQLPCWWSVQRISDAAGRSFVTLRRTVCFTSPQCPISRRTASTTSSVTADTRVQSRQQTERWRQTINPRI